MQAFYFRVAVLVCLAISIIAFTYEPLAELTAYLGIFWLLLMGVGQAFNGLVDRSRTYFITGGIEIMVNSYTAIRWRE